MAFDAIMDGYGALVAGAVMSKVGNAQDREDIVQEVFLSAHKSLESMTDRSRLSSWLLRITKRRIADFYTHQTRQSKLILLSNARDDEELSDREDLASVEPGPRELVEREVVYDHVLAEIAQLKPKNRDVVYLHLIDDMSLTMIGMRLKTKESTVRMRLMRGLIQLRARLRRLNDQLRDTAMNMRRHSTDLEMVDYLTGHASEQDEKAIEKELASAPDVRELQSTWQAVLNSIATESEEAKLISARSKEKVCARIRSSEGGHVGVRAVRLRERLSHYGTFLTVAAAAVIVLATSATFIAYLQGEPANSSEDQLANRSGLPSLSNAPEDAARPVERRLIVDSAVADSSSIQFRNTYASLVSAVADADPGDILVLNDSKIVETVRISKRLSLIALDGPKLTGMAL